MKRVIYRKSYSESLGMDSEFASELLCSVFCRSTICLQYLASSALLPLSAQISDFFSLVKMSSHDSNNHVMWSDVPSHDDEPVSVLVAPEHGGDRNTIRAYKAGWKGPETEKKMWRRSC